MRHLGNFQNYTQYIHICCYRCGGYYSSLL